jgi:transcriptional regulator with XRE-family HTH domain
MSLEKKSAFMDFSVDRLKVFAIIEQSDGWRRDFVDKTFGETLKDARVEAEVGLRELARLIETSAGYLSDVEKDKVPPPSVDLILSIAMALNADKWELLRAADKEVEFITKQPEAADFLRKTSDFGPDEWKKAGQLVEIAGLGKKGE